MEFKYTDEDIKRAAAEWINPIPEDDQIFITEEDYIIDGEKVTVLDYADPYLDADTQYYKAGLWYDGSWDDGPEALARQNVHEEFPCWNPAKGELQIDISELDFDLQKDCVRFAGMELKNSFYRKVRLLEDENGNKWLANSAIAYDYQQKKFIDKLDVPEDAI